jgi:streptomycin 6-kinase
LNPPQPLPSAVATKYQIVASTFVERTSIAEIWKVERKDGVIAALKIYKNHDMKNEDTGFAVMKVCGGIAAANVYSHGAGFALTEWLDGPSLGDLTRRGEDEKACEFLVEVANKIHAKPAAVSVALPALEDWFQSLFDFGFEDGCPPASRQMIARCKQIAHELLASQQDIRPLHGDFHHDNVKLGARGYCAFDAKGVLGERTFELANAFQNPMGARKVVRNTERIHSLADKWSQSFDVDRHRLLSWAAALSALSIAWDDGAQLKPESDLEMVGLLLAARLEV